VYSGEGGSFTEGDESFAYYYVYDKSTRTYSKFVPSATNKVVYDTTEHTYKTTEGADLYIFAYVTKQTLSADWTASGAKYSYKGGNVYVSANVYSNYDGVYRCENSLNVLVRVSSAKYETYEFKDANGAVTTKTGLPVAEYRDGKAVFSVDPFGTLKLFERNAGEYTGDRYVKNLDGSYTLNPNGTYGEFVDEDGNRYKAELTYAQLGSYKNLPEILTIVTADGTRLTVPVAWDLSGVNLSYAGKTFTGYAIINEDGRYNYEKTAGGYRNDVGEQRIPVTFDIINRTAVALANPSSLKGSSRVGYFYIDESTKNVVLNDAGYEYIDAYNWKLPTMPTSLTVKLADGTTKTFYKTSTTNKLEWSFNKFRPSYEGGVIYVTALLTGADGSTQSLDIPFIVAKRMVNRLVSLSATSTTSLAANSYSSYVNTTTGVASTSYTIDHRNPNKLTLPTGYTVTMNVYNPTYNAAKGEFEFPATASATETKTFSFVTVSMPANMSWTISGGVVSSSAAGSNATIYLGSQQRITVKIEAASSAAPTVSISVGGKILGTGSLSVENVKTLTAISNSRAVVWYGKAYVYDMDGSSIEAAIPVMFAANANNIKLPSYGMRKVVFKLYAAVGAVVNANGEVLTTKVATANSDGYIEVGDAKVYAVAKGQVIPVAQATSGLLSVENA